MEMDTIDLAEEEVGEDSEAYGVKVEVFEGPLDLLLYLIRKDELDIYDIPIAHITAEYLAFLEQVIRLNLEQASDFILMAATLMKIKAQELLPRPQSPEEGEEGDPREELMRRLLEYQQFKQVAEWLGVEAEARQGIYLRRSGPGQELDEAAELQPVSLFALLKAYKHVLDHVPKAVVHRIIEEEVSVDECVEYVLGVLGRRGRLRFYDLVQGKGTATFISTFIGLLELLKAQRIRVQQAQPFADIWIEGRASEQVVAPEGAPLE